MNIRLLLSFLISLFILAGCSEKLDFSIDNPTNQDIHVRIDETNYEIKARSAQDISLSPGKHQLESAAVGTIDFIVFAGRKGGMLNPTLSDYVIANEVYAVSGSRAQHFSPIRSSITLDGLLFKGPFKKLNGLFISTQWRYGLQEAFPGQIKVGSSDSRGGNIIDKIFYADDFVAYYRENYGEPTVDAKSVQPIDKEALLGLNSPLEFPAFEKENFQAATIPLRDLYSRYVAETNPAQQKKLQEQYHGMVSTYTSATSRLHMNQSKEENEKSNAFIIAIASAFGTGFIILR